MARHQYTKAHVLPRLREQLEAAGVRVEHLEGRDQTLIVHAPDSVAKAAVDAVVAAHDAAALAAAEATQRQADEQIRQQVFAAAAAAVGKHVGALTTTERNALTAVYLWRLGALSPTLTVRPLEEWAYGALPERAAGRS